MVVWQTVMKGLQMLGTRAGYRAIQAFLWALTVLGIVLLVLQLAKTMGDRFTADSILQFVHALLIPILPLLVLPCLASFLVLPEAHRYQAYVEAAWHGDDTRIPLAEHQPEPDAPTLTLPITIRLRPRWHVLLSMDVLFFLMAGLYVVAYDLTDTPPLSQPDLPTIFVFAIFALIFVIVLFTQRTASNGFTVSEEGMMMYMPSTPPDLYAITWSEARLFAIGVGRKKRPRELVYTLAAPGPGKFVHWPRLYQPPRWYAIREPTVPFAEYDQQMQTLLSLVAARTGLPLRDLR